MKIVLSLSGGMDSTTLLHSALHGGHQVQAVHFQYGSTHNPYELWSAKAVADHFVVPLEIINLHDAFNSIGSALMGDEPIPEGHYAGENMRKTVVPGRNMIMTAVLAGIAEASDAQEVWLGQHAGDHLIYPDCRPRFVEAVDLAVQASTEDKVRVAAPFLHIDKTKICAVGLQMGTPYELTRTCYKSQVLACGKCGACNERLEAFKLNNAVDPTTYGVL